MFAAGLNLDSRRLTWFFISLDSRLPPFGRSRLDGVVLAIAQIDDVGIDLRVACAVSRNEPKAFLEVPRIHVVQNRVPIATHAEVIAIEF